MKIVFVCGALEPGRDGVGDYTRRLAATLIQQGHEVALLGLYDFHLETKFEGLQEADGVLVPVLRVPAAWANEQRSAVARPWIEDQAPDWLSLQYVPFAFHHKGLAFGLDKTLARLGAGRRWHIMFHELWVGMDAESPAHHVPWGWVQKQLIKALLHRLRPGAIHTQTNVYQAQLAKLGRAAHYLPLFANIPVTPATPPEPAATRAAGKLVFVVFGNVQPGAPLEQFAQEAGRCARQAGTDFSLVAIGRCGSELGRLAAAWQAAGLAFEDLGEQPADRVSETLRRADIGISTTPFLQTEKSGTVAAMREHGLPVLCVARAWHPRGISRLASPTGVFQYQEGTLAAFIAAPPRHPFSNTVAEASRLLVAALSSLA